MWTNHFGYGEAMSSLPGVEFGKNITIFGADKGSSAHINNNKKDILVLGKGATNRLDNTAVAAEAKYYINITKSRKNFCLSLYYIGSNSFFYANGVINSSIQSKSL